ncbi:hypothetical protein [Pseudanabaena sp. 'Roaring Creek']|nr:hypothetical protein [Pseudanabaena sp. 'Roaring Creek']
MRHENLQLLRSRQTCYMGSLIGYWQPEIGTDFTINAFWTDLTD